MSSPATPPSRARVAAAFLTCASVWGSTFLFIRIGNETVPPVWGAALRLILATVVLGAWAALGRIALPRGEALKAACLLGTFQFGFNLPLLYWGEVSVPSGLTAVLFSLAPLVTAAMARAFGLERLHRGKVLGALVALAGVVLLFSSELDARAPLLPMLAVIGALVSACLGAALYKRGPRQSVVAANVVANAVGAVFCVTISLLVGERPMLPRTAASLVPVLYLAIAGSVGAFVIFTWLIQHWELSRASFVAVIVPLVALSLGVLVKGERVTPMLAAGSTVVLVGVWLGLGTGPRAGATPSPGSRAAPPPGGARADRDPPGR